MSVLICPFFRWFVALSTCVRSYHFVRLSLVFFVRVLARCLPDCVRPFAVFFRSFVVFSTASVLSFAFRSFVLCPTASVYSFAFFSVRALVCSFFARLRPSIWWLVPRLILCYPFLCLRMNRLYKKLEKATKALIFFTSRGWEVRTAFLLYLLNLVYSLVRHSVRNQRCFVSVLNGQLRPVVGGVEPAGPRGIGQRHLNPDSTWKRPPSPSPPFMHSPPPPPPPPPSPHFHFPVDRPTLANYITKHDASCRSNWVKMGPVSQRI